MSGLATRRRDDGDGHGQAHPPFWKSAGLVTTEKIGRTRQCRLGGERLDDVMTWISYYQRLWERRLDGLDAYFTLQKGTDR